VQGSNEYVQLVVPPGVFMNTQDSDYQCSTETKTYLTYNRRIVGNYYGCTTVTGSFSFIRPETTVGVVLFVRPPPNFCLFAENVTGILPYFNAFYASDDESDSRGQFKGPAYFCTNNVLLMSIDAVNFTLVPTQQAEYGKNYTFTSDSTMLLQFKIPVEYPAILTGSFGKDARAYYQTPGKNLEFYLKNRTVVTSSYPRENFFSFTSESTVNTASAGDFIRPVRGTEGSTVVYNVLTIQGTNIVMPSTSPTNNADPTNNVDPTNGSSSAGEMLAPAVVLFLSVAIGLCAF